METVIAADFRDVQEFTTSYVVPVMPVIVLLVMVYFGLKMATLWRRIRSEVDRILVIQLEARNTLEELKKLFQEMKERQGRETHQRARLSATLREVERRLDKTEPQTRESAKNSR